MSEGQVSAINKAPQKGETRPLYQKTPVLDPRILDERKDHFLFLIQQKKQFLKK